MKSDSCTTGVIFGGGIGLALGGPVGAVAGSVVGGEITDGITSGVDSAVHDKFQPAGIIRQATNLYNNPKDVGQWLDAGYTVATGGRGGYKVGQTEQPQENVKL